jgi:prepilin-type N-terminal cleavage/methylation domain-containing protein
MTVRSQAQPQAGFTLIEVTLVMVISSALAIIALTWFTGLRDQAQFTDSVERIKEGVLEQRQEALSTIKPGGGVDPFNITFGRLLTFTPGSSIIRVDTLITSNNSSPLATQGVIPLVGQSTTLKMAWGVTYAGSAVRKVAFTRSAVDGSLQTAVGEGTTWNGPVYSYGQFLPNQLPPTSTNARLPLRDVKGRPAYMQIDTTSNGVTRAFQ